MKNPLIQPMPALLPLLRVAGAEEIVVPETIAIDGKTMRRSGGRHWPHS